MSDETFTLGDILWEYADYTPPEPPPTPSVPLPPEVPPEAVPPPPPPVQPVQQPVTVPPAAPVVKTAPPPPPPPPAEAPAEKAPTVKETAPAQAAAPTPEAPPVQEAAPAQETPPVQEEMPAQEVDTSVPPPPPPPEYGPRSQTKTTRGPVREPTYAPRRERRPRPGPEAPPDAEAALLAEEYSQGLEGRKSRCVFSGILTVFLLALSLLDTGILPIPESAVPEVILLATGLVLFAVILGLCWEVLQTGLVQLTNGTPDQDTLALFAAVFTLIDGVTLLFLPIRETAMPFFAPCALVLTFHLLGQYFTQSARLLACRTASAVQQPYVVTQDPGVLNGQPAFRKWMGPLTGFGSQVRTLSDGEFRFQRLTPVLLTACFVLSLMTTVFHKQANLAFWSLSALFCAASTLGASLTFSLPLRALKKKLEKNGVALAGWPGVAAGKGAKSLVLGDYDLYPPGSVHIQSARAFGQWSIDRAISFTASVLQGARSGLAYPFVRLVQTQHVNYVDLQSLTVEDNGFTARSDGLTILVGNSDFMSRQAVALPQGIRGRDALFCAVGGEMAGVFMLKYNLHSAIHPALGSLFAHRFYPILATRDFNLTPHRLRLKGRLSLNHLSFPDLQRRIDLSNSEQIHGSPILAVICREGLPPFMDTLVGAKRLRRAGTLGSWMVNISACVGVFLTASLSSAGAMGAMCAWNLALYLLLWLAPVVFLSLWTKQY